MRRRLVGKANSRPAATHVLLLTLPPAPAAWHNPFLNAGPVPLVALGSSPGARPAHRAAVSPTRGGGLFRSPSCLPITQTTQSRPAGNRPAQPPWRWRRPSAWR
jgi:hypothetical protein